MSKTNTIAVKKSYDQSIDGILSPFQWADSSITFSFPTDNTNYQGGGNFHNAMKVLSDSAKSVVRTITAEVSEFTKLNFTEITESATNKATLTYAHSVSAIGGGVAAMPGSISTDGRIPNAGDAFFNLDGETDRQFLGPRIGEMGYFVYLHEIGHTLGLKHGHDDGTNPGHYGYGHLPIWVNS